MIDIYTPVWIRGTVIRYEPRYPHVLIHVEEKRVGGMARSLIIEGPIMSRLERMNLARDFIKPGDVIELCGFPFRKGTSLPAVHAHLLVHADGKGQPWGPYGKLDNCVRAGDSAQTWTAFVNAMPMAREYWCRGLAYTGAPSVAPRSLVEEVGLGMAEPCK
jgi:hypothetical protein